MYRVGLYTLGCKVSLYETEAIAEKFEALGFERASFEEVCDVYLINTCTVTAESDAKSRKYIRRAIRKNPSAVVCVVGCYSQNSPREIEELEGVSVILGTKDKLSAPEYALDILEGRRCAPIVSVGTLDGVGFEKMRISQAPRTRAYVKIEDGCECKCSYCAISTARGPVRSKPMAEVVAEVESLSEKGTREIVLTGIETGSWGADLEEGVGLAELILELDRRGSCSRIRLGSMAPELVTEDFLKKISSTRIMTPHIHLSVQSASGAVLRGMKRRYNSDMLYRCTDNISKYMNGATITADLMVGFPGESDEDFRETFEFVEKAGLLDAHVFAYSKRANTPAALYPDQTGDGVKQERSRALIKEVERVRDITLGKIVQKERLEVVFETAIRGGYVGHSAEYAEVFALSEKDVRGELVTVEAEEHKNGIIYAKKII